MDIISRITQMFSGKKEDNSLTKQECIQLLKTDPEKFEEFEKRYQNAVLQEDYPQRDTNTKILDMSETIKNIIDRIVTGCLLETYPEYVEHPESFKPVEIDEIYSLPKEFRPQFTEKYTTKDCKGENYKEILWFYQKSLEEKNSLKKQELYSRFRIGLDLLDLDWVMYEILNRNVNSIGYWFPSLKSAVEKQSFFKVPDTKIRKLPLTMLQMTRLQYESLTPVTRRIINEYCKKVFELGEDKQYFVKNGVYSNKFDFRNCRVVGKEEVDTLGEYLLFNHNLAVSMAGPLNKPSIYGPATTNEWCVREFIDTNDTQDEFYKIRTGILVPDKAYDYIYHGLELRNELRAFVDFDTKEIFGICQYWDPDTMKHRFNNYSDSDMPTTKHDAIVFGVYEDILTQRFNNTKDLIKEKLQDVVNNMDLHGQWSIDIMEKKSVKDYAGMTKDSDDEFYIIDMALATQSAFSERFKDVLKPVQETLLPTNEPEI